MQSIDLIETYAYGTNKDLASEKQKINCNNIIKQKMINFDDVTKKDIKEHNPNWSEISDNPYRILTIRGSGSRETNALLNLINNEPDIDKNYLNIKDPHEAKYQLLVNKRESTV